jgi:carboxyl-terminal processing protease
MVNKGSASASEIFAGAMRDDKGTKLVGETSFGKGTIQEPLTIDGGAGIHITTARWLTPNGTWVHEKGLDPDIKVEDKADTSADEQLQEALKILE